MNGKDSFGNWLRQRRKALDLTQVELAGQVGCAVVTIQKIEKDSARPSKQMAERLADVLALSPDERAEFMAFARHSNESLPALPINNRHREPLNNLPFQPTPFVGRASELAHIAHHFKTPDCRLLTLIGEGGIGKTRLALQAAHENSLNFADGVYFVSLASLADPELIVSTVAETVGFQFYPGGTPKQQLLDFFRAKSMLVVLDNFEHLLSGATLVTDILQAAPDVKFIATSRERLNLQEETLFRVEGMDLPDSELMESASEYDAVKLFVQSAHRVQSSFGLTNDNLKHLVRICRQVEGMPLGILLAAAWVDNLTLAEISDEIEQSLDILETEARNVPSRQRSVRAVFDHSWAMLNATEQSVFSQLSMFRGGFTREAVQAVTGATLKMLAALVHKSLLRRDPNGRYGIHELLRQYAELKLNDSPDGLDTARDQHCAYFAALMERQAPRLKGPAEKEALALIEAELDNVRAAWDYALAVEQFDVIDSSAEALALFCFINQRYVAECEQLLQKAIDRLRPCAMTIPLRVLLGQLLAMFAFFCANVHPEPATAAFSEADDLLQANATEYEQAIGHLWWAMRRPFLWPTWNRLTGQELDAMRERQKRCQVIFQLSGDTWRLALSQAASTGLEAGVHDLLAADISAQQSLSLFQTLGTRFWQSLPLGMLAFWATARKEYTTANDYNRQSIALSQEFGHDLDAAVSLVGLGQNCQASGEYAEAQTHFARSLALHERVGNKFGMGFALLSLGIVARLQQRYAEAYSYHQQALVIWRQFGTQEEVSNVSNEMAAVAIAEGRYDLAEQHCREALSIYIHTDGLHRTLCIESLFRFGYVTAKSGNLARSIGILTVAVAFLEELYRASDVDEIVFDELHTLGEKYLTEVRAELPPDEFAAAQERSKLLKLESLAADILASPPLFLPSTADES